MYFSVRLTQQVHVDPTHFHEELLKIVRYQLCKEVEGTIDEDHGMIIAVHTSSDEGDENAIVIGPGVLMDTGPASFKVHYTAIVLRPFEGEVVDVVVTKVTDIGLFGSLGPIEIFVSSRSSMPGDYQYDDTEAKRPKYVGTDDAIGIGDQVRLTIKGVEITNTDVKTVGDICENYMGKISA